MRIAHVVTLHGEDGAFGGPLSVAIEQCRALAARGHTVRLICGWDGAADPLILEMVDEELHRVQRWVPVSGFAGLGSLRLMKRLTRMSDVDLVHVHAARDLVSTPAGLLTRAPLVIQTHGMYAPDARARTKLFDAVLGRRLLRRARVVIALSDDEKASLSPLLPPQQKVRILPNGVAAPGYVSHWSGDQPPRILFSARLQARKRPSAFLEMADLLRRSGIDSRYVIMGPDGGELCSIERQIAELFLENQVKYIGAFERAEALRRMATAQIYVLPSVNEPYPMSVLEALALGMPTVITNSTGISNLVRGRPGVAVTDGTAAGLADGLRPWLSEQPWRRAHEGALTLHSQYFGMEPVARQLEAIYAEAVRAS